MKKRSSATETLPVLLLFCVFLGAAVVLLLSGLRVWHTTESRLQSTFDTQVPLAYVAGKVRASDALAVETLPDGTEALVLSASIDGEAYLTRLYCMDGALYELFTPADVTIAPADGVRLTKVRALTFSEGENGLLRASCTAADGTESTLLLAARGQEDV